MSKESFVLYAEYEDYFNVLSDVDGMKLLKAIFAYKRRGEVHELDGMAKAFFMVIRNNLDRDAQKYAERCEKSVKSARMRWHANGCEGTQSHANDADTVPDPDPDPVSETDNTGVPPVQETPDMHVSKPEKPLPGEAKKLAALLGALHHAQDPVYTTGDAQLRNWAEDIEKLNRIDGRSWDDIEAAIRWAKQPDNFWFPNIMSGKKLREKFPTLVAQMKRPSQAGPRNRIAADSETGGKW